MLQLIALTCSLAAAAAQQYFYCNTSQPIGIAEEPDFYLITRPSWLSGYPPGLSCEFNAESNSTAFFVEVQSARISTAVFTISSGGQTLFSGSSIPAYQSSITTPSASLQVKFDATGDQSNSEGVTVRVRVMDSDECPPGWALLYDSCYGNSNTSGRLAFDDAQKACNSMRSNLLQLPEATDNESVSIGTLVGTLPGGLKASDSWVGLTDKTSAGQFIHYWLDGRREYHTSEIGCMSGGAEEGTTQCLATERCGSINARAAWRRAIYMDDCTKLHGFACSMQPGGSDTLYPVPVLPVRHINRDWIWGVAALSVFGVGIAALAAYACMRSHRARAYV